MVIFAIPEDRGEDNHAVCSVSLEFTNLTSLTVLSWEVYISH